MATGSYASELLEAHQHRKIGAESCRSCEQACRRLRELLRWPNASLEAREP